MTTVGDTARDKISAAMADTLPGLTVRWVTVVEVIDEDGQEAVWNLHSEGMAVWHAMGLLQFGLENQRLRLYENDDIYDPELGDEE